MKLLVILFIMNINSVRNADKKFQVPEKEICANLDIFLILKVKLDDSFPSA